MKRKNKVALLVLAFSAVSSLASCGLTDGASSHTHEFEEHEEVFPTCVETGTEPYKTCKTCNKYFDMNGKEIDAPKVTPIDPNNHKGTKELAISGSYRTKYVVGESFDMENAVFAIKCEHCEGSSLSDAKKGKVHITYPTADASSFTVDDLAKTELKVTFEYSNLIATANVTLSKKENIITGLEAMNKHCGFKPFTELDGVSSTFGKIVYTFSETEDGDYKSAAELGEDYVFMNDPDSSSPKVYYVKATVSEGADYDGAEISTTLTISHNEAVWSTENEEYDVFGCICQTPVKFNKKVAAFQTLDLSGTTVSMNLDGTSYDASKHTIKSIKYVVDESTTYDLGTDLTNLDVTALKADVDHHGEAVLDIVVNTPQDGLVPSFDHSIEAPVTLATATITTATEYQERIISSTEIKKGYFKLMNDIGINNIIESFGFDWNYGFGGTLDGNGKTITCKSGALYGAFSNLIGATIKDLTLADGWYSAYGVVSLIAKGVLNTTFSNVKTKVTAGGTGNLKIEENRGYLAYGKFMNNKLTDCEFDASGRQMPILIGRGQNFNDANVFSNCVVKASELVEAMHSNYTGKTYQPSNVTLEDGEEAIAGLTFTKA